MLMLAMTSGSKQTGGRSLTSAEGCCPLKEKGQIIMEKLKEQFLIKNREMLEFYMNKLEPELLKHILCDVNLNTLDKVRVLNESIIYWGSKDESKRKEVMAMFGIGQKKRG
jgi:hypothetical protein